MNSKDKGSRFEREVARVLGKWLFNDEHALYRSHSSGALSTVRGSASGLQTGDIAPVKPDVYFPLHIECKNYSRLNWGALFSKEPEDLDLIAWTKKARAEAGSVKMAVLIVKLTRHETLWIRESGKLERTAGVEPLWSIWINGRDTLYAYDFKDVISSGRLADLLICRTRAR